MIKANIIRKRRTLATAGLFIAAVCALDESSRRKKEPTRTWIARRKEKGAFYNLRRELLLEDRNAYRYVIFYCHK